MNFVEPYWLIAGLAACGLLWWSYRRYDRQQRMALNAFASPHLIEKLTRSVSERRRMIKRILITLGIACLFIALARPRWGYRWEETHREGLDILFAVDTSKSMLAQDVKPDRLTRAKLAVNDLVDKLDGDQVGLIAFAGDAFVQSPMTLDYDAFRESLNALDTSTIPRGGTDIASAIGEAKAAFQTQNDHDKILILVTDGEDLEGSALTAAESAAKDGVKIFTVGVGSTTGELIPVPIEGGTEFLKDQTGQFVKSHLDESMLKKIAAATGGMYQPLGQQGEGLAEIYRQGLAPFQRHDVASRQQRVYLERFEWPLLAGLIFLLANFFIGTRKRQWRKVKTPESAKARRFVPRRPKLAAPAAAAAVLLLILMSPGFALASPQSAEKAYKKGDFSDAVQQYQEAAAKAPDAPELQFNDGSAEYKAKMYDKAAEAFQKSLKTDHLDLQQSTYYNLGNTLYRQGQESQKADPKQTIATWQKAVQSYESALQLKPDDADAIYNRDFVKKKLEKLQQQQNKDKKDQKDQSKQDQKNQDQKPQNQNKQNQGKPDQDKQDQSKPDQSKPGQGKPDQTKPDQGNPDQGKPDQKNQDQSKAQPKPGDQSQQPKPETGKQQQPDRKPAANAQPQTAKPDAKDQANSQPRNDDSKDSAEAPAVPGQMTPEEAKALLDSVKGDEHQLPAAPVGRNPDKDENKPTLKDW